MANENVTPNRLLSRGGENEMMQKLWFELPLLDDKTAKFIEQYPPFKTVRGLIDNLNRENRRILEIQQQKRNDLRNMKMWKLNQDRG